MLAIAAGFLAVLALGIGLLRSTHSATPASAPPAARAAAAPGAAAIAEPASAGARPAPPGESRPAAASPRARAAPRSDQPELAPAPIGFGRELKRDANGKLVPIVPVDDLRAQLPRLATPVNECIEHSGRRPTGNAVLSFTVAASHNKLVVETTGVEDPDSLADYPELLECMHRTANVLLLDGHPIPELGTPIYVRRHVRLERGELAEDTIFNFSYNP